ncbi:helix-turn-helix domain-containing protein [Streptomyces nojiriensis]|uniref:helix-turn-helix domain-containing protein n=1 Tax=Streptomyces nojiriensis TaxID=66374 RepID=UPI003675FCEC
MSVSVEGKTEGEPSDGDRPAQHRQQFADLLTDLKDRRGHSYETLARKAHMSRSSVHRYCRGIVIPVEFGTAERIARICGATPRELAALYRCWAAASAPGTDAEDPLPPSAAEPGTEEAGTEEAGTAAEERPRAAAGPQEAGPAPAAARTVPRQRGGARLALVSVAFILLCVASLSGSAPAATPWTPGTPSRPLAADGAGPASGAGSGTAVPSWAQAPTPVSDGLFGMTLNSNTGAMPTFQVDTVRLWDTRTRWANIQPRRGVYDWSVLDRLVTAANQAGLPVVFTMGGTPDWASPHGPRAAYDDGSRTSPPDDPTDWKAFVTAVADRYRGRIDAYELWVMGNDTRYFSGSLETLAEMTRTAKAVLDAVDPDATVVCPSMGRLWEPDALRALERFAELRAYDSCDVAGVKLYQRSASDPPEQLHGMIQEIDRAFHRGGAHPRLWSTGASYEIALQKPLDEATASAHAVRFFLVGLYARYPRMYYYNWGGTKVPIVMQPEGQPPTRAALDVEELRRWVHGTRIHSCGNGVAAGLPVGVWQCRFDRDGAEQVIVWHETGTARIPAPRKTGAVRHLDGTVSALPSDRTVEVTTMPVLLTRAP